MDQGIPRELNPGLADFSVIFSVALATNESVLTTRINDPRYKQVGYSNVVIHSDVCFYKPEIGHDLLEGMPVDRMFPGLPNKSHASSPCGECLSISDQIMRARATYMVANPKLWSSTQVML
jgi:hypothetical protein